MFAPAFFAYINAAVTEVISRCCGVIVLSFFSYFASLVTFFSKKVTYASGR